MYQHIPDTHYWPNQTYCPCCGQRKQPAAWGPLPPIYPPAKVSDLPEDLKKQILDWMEKNKNAIK